MELSAHVGTRRRQLRLTQEEVSERLRRRGIERAASTIAHWEAGRQAIPLEILPDLAAALEEEVVVLYELAGILDRIPAEQSIAPASIQERYRQQVSALAERLDILRRRELEMQSVATRGAREQAAKAASLDEIRTLTLERFWQLPDRRINQILRRVIGERRLVVLDKKIIGSSIPQPHGT